MRASQKNNFRRTRRACVHAALRAAFFFVFVSTIISQVPQNYFHLFEKKLLTRKQDRERVSPDRRHHAGDEETKNQTTK